MFENGTPESHCKYIQHIWVVIDKNFKDLTDSRNIRIFTLY